LGLSYTITQIPRFICAEVLKQVEPYYKNCIETSLIRENNWLCLCKKLKIPGAVGLTACIVGGIRYVGDRRVKMCIFLEEEIWARRIVWKRLCQEYQKA